MLTELLKSPAAAELLAQIQGQGLTAPQASAALAATAEGVTEQVGSSGGLAGMAAGLMGGAGGGLGALGGLLGGGSAAPGVSALAGPVAAFVAQKTGMEPAMAQTVVNAVLPKLMSMITGASA